MSVDQQSQIKELIEDGQGYLTYSEVNDQFEDSPDPDQVEDIIQMINDMGIKVFETAPDADDLLLKTNPSMILPLLKPQPHSPQLRLKPAGPLTP